MTQNHLMHTIASKSYLAKTQANLIQGIIFNVFFFFFEEQ